MQFDHWNVVALEVVGGPVTAWHCVAEDHEDARGLTLEEGDKPLWYTCVCVCVLSRGQLSKTITIGHEIIMAQSSVSRFCGECYLTFHPVSS